MSINSLPAANISKGTAQIGFTWNPKQTAFTYSAAGTTYSPNADPSVGEGRSSGASFAATWIPITFVASSVFPLDRSSVEHYWTFGDGTFSYGSTVTHTYKVPNQSTQVVLRITDNKGSRYYTRQQLYVKEYLTAILVPAVTLALT